MRGIRRFNKRVFLPFVLLAVGIAFGSSWLIKSLGSKVEIENHALVALKSVEVWLGDEKLQFGKIGVPGRTDAKFTPSGEPTLLVKVRKENGDSVNLRGRYKPGGWFGTQIKIIVRDDRIEVQQGNP